MINFNCEKLDKARLHIKSQISILYSSRTFSSTGKNWQKETEQHSTESHGKHERRKYQAGWKAFRTVHFYQGRNPHKYCRRIKRDIYFCEKGREEDEQVYWQLIQKKADPLDGPFQIIENIILKIARTDNQIDRLTDRQTGRQTDRQTDKQANKQIDSQTDIKLRHVLYEPKVQTAPSKNDCDRPRQSMVGLQETRKLKERKADRSMR